MRNASSTTEISTPQPRTKTSELLRWVKPIAPIVAAFVLQALASRNPQWVERYYSRKIFPPIIRVLSLVNGLVGFSIGEFMIYVLTAALAVILFQQLREVYGRRKSIAQVLRADLLLLTWILGSGMLGFLLIWGLNYQREPLGARFGLTGRNASDDQLKLISEVIVNEVNSNYTASHPSNPDGSPAPPPDRALVYALVESAYEHEPLLADVAGRRFGPPKPVYASSLMSRLGLSGFYMPFTGEPNFNAAQPDFDLPYVIAHEKAHQRGFAHEDEANFIAFLVCVNSTDPYLRYSGYLNALKVLDAVPASDVVFYRSLFARIGDGPRNDLRARTAFWSRYQGPARVAAERVNDSYLKANRIPSGTGNYGEDIALIVGYYLKRAQSDPAILQSNQ
jgi:hypothetical protein